MRLKDSLNGYLRLPRTFFGIPSPKVNLPDVGILGIPYDLTSSYFPGCRFGPDAIRQATDSERSHSYSLQIGRKEFIENEPLSKRITIEDVGDLEVVYRLPEQAVYDISEASSKLAKHGTFLLFLGGDHFITYPILRGLSRAGDRDIGIVYLDAHADFYDDMGGTQYSHATTLKRIVADELVKLENVLAYDVRSALPEQVKELNNGSLPLVQDMTSFTKRLNEINERVDLIYLSLDLDVLTPELVPGVSHSESGGVSFKEIVTILREIFATRKVQYADLVEFNPLLDRTGVTSTHARDLVKEILSGFAYQKEYK
jgi:agmatinase